jgi:hypothetical protein
MRQKKAGDMKIGYLRVFRQEQHEALQVDALKEADCEKLFADKVTGWVAPSSICIFQINLLLTVALLPQLTTCTFYCTIFCERRLP